MTCVFFGHRDTPSDIYPKLKSAIKSLIENKEATDFYVGNHGSFDRMVRKALKELKAQYPEINYRVVLAYLPLKAYPEKDYSDTEFPEGIEFVPKKFAVNFRNDYMLKKADYVIAYVTHSFGGAARFTEKAKKRKAEIINLAE